MSTLLEETEEQVTGTLDKVQLDVCSQLRLKSKKLSQVTELLGSRSS